MHCHSPSLKWKTRFHLQHLYSYDIYREVYAPQMTAENYTTIKPILLVLPQVDFQVFENLQCVPTHGATPNLL